MTTAVTAVSLNCSGNENSTLNLSRVRSFIFGSSPRCGGWPRLAGAVVWVRADIWMETRLIFDPSEASAKQSSAHLAKYHKIFSFAQPGRAAVWGMEGGVCFPKICGVNSATLQKLIFAHVTSFCTLRSPADFIHLDNMFPFKHLHCA